MRTRPLLATCAVALVAASCSQPDPKVVSEAPRSTGSTDLTRPSDEPGQPHKPGRFIARCATEADGNGTPGLTIFTDGSQGVTDHCLRRYYIGVQPAPGSVYVPDDEAGTNAPNRGATTPTGSATGTWTPAQPRTDLGTRRPLPTEGPSAGTGAQDTAEAGSGTESGGQTPVTTKPGTTPPQTPGTDVGPTIPGATLPGTTIPGTTLPGTTLPGTTLPGTTLPGTGQPGGTTPGGTNPGTTPGGEGSQAPATTPGGGATGTIPTRPSNPTPAWPWQGSNSITGSLLPGAGAPSDAGQPAPSVAETSVPTAR